MLSVSLICLKVVPLPALLSRITTWDICIYMNKRFILEKNPRLVEELLMRKSKTKMSKDLKDNWGIGTGIKDMIKIYYI